jgi:hypothetical protein
MHCSALLLAVSLLGAAALEAGCANGTTSLVTGSVSYPTTGPLSGNATGEVPTRTARTATTSARAQICGIAFDSAKLRASYLAYEAKQGASGAQLSSIEKSYDATLTTTMTQSAAIANQCSSQQVAWTTDRNAEFSQQYKEQLKADLTRYLAGSFTQDADAEAPFTSKAFWKDQDDG